MTRPVVPGAATVRPVVDCVIVGGGPVGLLTAIFLGQAGMEVSVFEPSAAALPIAEGLHHRSRVPPHPAGRRADGRSRRPVRTVTR